MNIHMGTVSRAAGKGPFSFLSRLPGLVSSDESLSIVTESEISICASQEVWVELLAADNPNGDAGTVDRRDLHRWRRRRGFSFSSSLISVGKSCFLGHKTRRRTYDRGFTFSAVLTRSPGAYRAVNNQLVHELDAAVAAYSHTQFMLLSPPTSAGYFSLSWARVA